MSLIFNSSLDWAHPLVRQWFSSQLGEPTEPQRLGWPEILAKKSTLISAPTGSGKTLAAFLACIDQLIRKALDGTLESRTEVLYVSPLKALSNDIQKNLYKPLLEIKELAESQGLSIKPIEVLVRTGDTLQKERQLMLKKPPHILVTTPESLYILLTAEKSRELLRSVKTVIIDEIHALANDKRGAHLALSLERLEALTKTPPVRIGLSATQKPIELVARFLTGNDRPLPALINIGHQRHLALKVEVPSSELGPVASNEMWDEIYNQLSEIANAHRSTLIFVNTRRLAERVAHHLQERLGEDQVIAHHGSLSRKIRFQAETKLKNGELKALVATASLELGIDIGSIDVVCQIGSPRAISIALQRVGRAGHWHGAISKGHFFVTTRDELMECAALVNAIITGDLDQLIIPTEPLDILAQQIVATCSSEDWQVEDLFCLVKHAYHYHTLTREKFNEIIHLLSDGIAATRGRFGSYLFYDKVNGILKARRGARLSAIMNGGAIPENGLFTVVAEPNEVMVGTLDEDFAVESNRGDIILLGTTSWMIKRVESSRGRVIVEDAHGAPPSVPFWRGEAPSRTNELSFQVSLLREKISALIPAFHANNDDIKKHPNAQHAMQWVKDNCKLDDMGAEQLVEYVIMGRAVLGKVPSQKTIIAERFFDESGGMQLIIHAPFGARINKAWGLALRKRFCRSFNFELQAAATDDGLNIALLEQHSFPLADVFHFLHPNTIRDVLTQAALQSPIFNTRWRWVATRSLAIKRFNFGKKLPPNILRMLSDDLLAAVFPDAAACQDNLAGKDVELPKHPLIEETMKDVLTEAMDIDGLIHVLNQIIHGEIECLAVDTPVPSQFSHEILNANPYAYLDDAPLEERRARAVEMRRMLPEAVLKEVGKLDSSAIAEVKEQAWPDIRNADELHDLLQTLIALPMKDIDRFPEWKIFLDQLITEHRADIGVINDISFCVSADRKKTFSTIYLTSRFQYQNKVYDEDIVIDQETAITKMIQGWLLHLGPTTSASLANRVSLPQTEVDQALLKLESTGFVMRGSFEFSDRNIIEWCERRLLSRIHRLTIGRLRKEIEPVSSQQFMRWLLKWQHVAPQTQLQGEQGLLMVIKQLQGFELPANAWEKQIFARRVKDYQQSQLDYLCLSGAVGWGRLSPHPITKNEIEDENKKRITPTSVAPITFFVREESAWLKELEHSTKMFEFLSHTAKQIYNYLKENGASFFADIVRELHMLKTEVENGMYELVASGLVTADGFDPLRAFIDPKRRLNKRTRRPRLQFSAGRWVLLRTKSVAEKNEQLEATCQLLLKRYGVVFRDLLTREKNIPRWRELLVTFRRLEDRGEIRGGRFVSGFLGEQFALPHAVESLRSIKKENPKEEIIHLSAVDPLNLVGIIIPGDKIISHSTKNITLKDGEFISHQ